MRIDHDMVVSSFFHTIEVVVVDPLAVVVFSVRHDVSHISALDGRVSIIDHELVCLVEMALIIAY